jgi:hypothetical protein
LDKFGVFNHIHISLRFSVSNAEQVILCPAAPGDRMHLEQTICLAQKLPATTGNIDQ